MTLYIDLLEGFLCVSPGVFRPPDKLADVRIFISEVLSNPASLFSLSAFGKQITDEQATLVKLGLVSVHTCVVILNVYLLIT